VIGLHREPRKGREVDHHEDGQGNPAAGSHRRAGGGEYGRHVVADQMRTLAQAFKIQAEIIKKNKKKKKK
jgi:hypothetical protein